MKIKLLIIMLFVFLSASAQSNLVASGGKSIGSNGSLTYTAGQIDYTTINSSTGSLTLGLQQPYEILMLEVVDFTPIVNLLLYPNPTYQNVNLIVSDFNGQKMSYSLSDITGKVLLENQITQQETIIPLENYSSSIYIVTVYSNDKNSRKSFKIIKK